jgi:hypothetical protein
MQNNNIRIGKNAGRETGIPKLTRPPAGETAVSQKIQK